MLDHDYLTGGVIELERRATYWARYLQSSFSSFRLAGGLWSKWKGLLSPASLLRLMYERVRGRLVIGEARPYFYLSFLRIAISIPMLIILSVAWLWIDNHQIHIAATLAADFGSDNPDLSSTEAETLWKLSGESFPVRKKFLQDVLETESAAARFDARARRVLHTVVRLDFGDADSFGHQLLPGCYSRDLSVASRITIACGSLVQAFDPNSEAALHFYISSIPASTDLLNGEGLREPLVDGLRTTGKMVSDDAVRANAAFIVTQLKGSNQPNPLVALTHALSTLGPRMPRERQSEAAAWITSILCKTDYPPQQGLLAVGLGPFTSHLENREVQPAVSCLTKSIDQSHGADLEYLAEGLDAIREHVPAETFKHAADVLIKEMNVTTRDDVVGELAKGIAALKVSLTDDQLRTIEGAMVERPRITTQLYDFYDSPGSVGQILKNQSASSSSRQIVIGQIMKVFKESDDPLQLVALARILNVSGGPLSGPDTNALADKIVKSFKSMPGFAGELGAEIAPLVSTNLSSAEISKYRAGLVQRAKDVASDSDPDRLAGFVKAYGALGGYSSSDDDTLIQLVLSKMSSVPKPTGASKSSVEERIQGRISLQEALAELDSHADDVANRAQLNALLSLLRDGTQPSCDAINPFIRKNTIPETADVLKWPTCSPEARDHILTKLEQAVGEHFESAQDGAYESRLREFVAWSRRNGLDVSGPPRFESKKVD